MPALPPLHTPPSPVDVSEPAAKSRSWLRIGLVALVVAAVAVWYLWTRVTRLETQLADVEQRAEQLDKRLADARGEAARLLEESETAQATAEQAQHETVVESTARQQAELEREFARDAAVKAQLDSERAGVEAERSRAEADNLRKARQRELDRMEEALSRIAETSRTPLGMVVSLGEDRFLFDFDKADLRPENRELLSRITGVLLASHGFRLYVYGHTDDVGTQQYNQDLSQRRAKSVRDYFVEAGLPADIIDVKGFGKTSPRVPGKTREARRKNRRVEIGVVDTIIDYDKVVVGTAK